MLTINFIGCGHLGKTLGRVITQNRLGIIQGILTTSRVSADSARQFIGAGKSYNTLSELPSANVYFITTCDDSIEMVGQQLIAEAPINKNAIFVHCSGSLSSDVLQPVRTIGGYAISVHPLKSFANPDLDVKSFANTYCAYEGDKEILPVITSLFEGMGAILFPVNKEQKMAYHAASVIANNYLVSLHHIATETYKIAGLDESIAYRITSMLMRSALQNLQAADHENALTGPLQRGDISIIKKHLVALDCVPQVKAIYKLLGYATVPLTSHTKRLKEIFNTLFLE